MQQNAYKNIRAFQLALELEHSINKLPHGKKTSQDEIRINPTEAIVDALCVFADAEFSYSETARAIADDFEKFRGMDLQMALEKRPGLLNDLVERIKTLSDVYTKDILS